MKKIAILSFILACSFALDVRETAAQVRLGANVGYNLDAERWFVGGQLRYGTPSLPITFNPSLEVQLDVPGASIWELDVNGIYHIGRNYTTTFTPYFGAGLGVLYVNPESDLVDSNTELGLNLVAGADFGSGSLQPFVEARIQVMDGATPVSVRGGLLFGL